MLADFWACQAFAIRDVEFTWLDVALGAMARGEWPAFEERLAHGLACVARAEAENALPSEDAIDAAATAFRYDRDLIAAADVDAWLERSGVAADDWIAYLHRDLLRSQWSAELDDTLDRFAPSARQLSDAAVAEGICSDTFDTHLNGLAGRAASVFEHDPEQFRRVCLHRQVPASLATEAGQLAHTHAHWLATRPAAELSARVAAVLHIELTFNALVDGLAANGRLGEIVETNRLEWMRFELDTVSFAIESAAREALLCIREDGLTLYDVAALSHRSVARKTMALEEIEPEHHDRLLAAEPGRIIGPLAVDDRFAVTAVVSRTPATLADPAVAARARQALVEMTIERAVRTHVTRAAMLSSPRTQSTGGEAA
jgi:hypothetical protein